MTLKQHAIQASIGSIILTPFLGADTVAFFLSNILIDIDHYFDFAIVCRRFSIRDMFKYHNWVQQENKSMYAISLFHTLEVFLLLFMLGFWSHYFWIILFGFSVHLLFDLYFLYKHNCFFSRAFSIVEYIIRRTKEKGYPVPENGFWSK